MQATSHCVDGLLLSTNAGLRCSRQAGCLLVSGATQEHDTVKVGIAGSS